MLMDTYMRKYIKFEICVVVHVIIIYANEKINDFWITLA
jgi:hypothetical protein